MYDEMAGLGQINQAMERAVYPKHVTYTERVTAAVADTEQRLKDLKRMQEIFAQHPEFEELLTLVQRGHV